MVKDFKSFFPIVSHVFLEIGKWCCVFQSKPFCPIQKSLVCFTASSVKSSRSAITNKNLGALHSQPEKWEGGLLEHTSPKHSGITPQPQGILAALESQLMQDCSWGVCVAHTCELCNLCSLAWSTHVPCDPGDTNKAVAQGGCQADKSCHEGFPAGREVGMAAAAPTLLWIGGTLYLRVRARPWGARASRISSDLG